MASGSACESLASLRQRNIYELRPSEIFRGGAALLRGKHLIEVGHRNSGEAEITKGLTPGAELILHPSTEVKEGMRVVKR